MPRPGFLHTSPVHVETFDALLAATRPDVTAIHAVQESLLADARRDGPSSVVRSVVDALAELRDRGASAVCCTCSTIGDVAERADIGIPVFRVDRPMAHRAVTGGSKIGVVAALESTLEPTRTLLEQEAALADVSPSLTMRTVSGAWELFEAGDQDGYALAIAREVRELAADVDLIVLAQASMAAAEHYLGDLDIPVMSSPAPAVAHLAHLLV